MLQVVWIKYGNKENDGFYYFFSMLGVIAAGLLTSNCSNWNGIHKRGPGKNYIAPNTADSRTTAHAFFPNLYSFFDRTLVPGELQVSIEIESILNEFYTTVRLKYDNESEIDARLVW